MSRPSRTYPERFKARPTLVLLETKESPDTLTDLAAVATLGDLFGPTAFLRHVSLGDLPTEREQQAAAAGRADRPVATPAAEPERPTAGGRTTEDAVRPEPVRPSRADLLEADGPAAGLSLVSAVPTRPAAVGGAGESGPRPGSRGPGATPKPAAEAGAAKPAPTNTLDSSPATAAAAAPVAAKGAVAKPPAPKAVKPAKGPKSGLDTITVEKIGRHHELSGGVGGFRVWRSGTRGDLTVRYTVAGGAVPGVDYTPLTGTVTIPDENRSAAVRLDPLKFDPVTGYKTVRLTLRADPTYALGETATGRVRLGLFEAAPVVSIEAIDAAASDVGQPNRGTVKISRTTTVGDLKVDVLLGGTAVAGEDYQPLRTTVVVPAGMTWASFRVTPVSDAVAEGTETVEVSVRPSTRYTIGPEAAAVVRISDTAGRTARTGPQYTLTAPELSIFYCECGCVEGTPSAYGTWGAVGGVAAGLAPNPFSANPVHYGTGQVRLGSTDLGGGGIGLPWGQGRTWSNLDGYDGHSQLGRGWATEQAPYLAREASNLPVIVVFSANYTQTFNEGAGSVFSADLGRPETLTYNSAAKEFTYTDTTGRVTVFYDFDASHPAEQAGGLKSITEPDGTVTSVTSRDGAGRITEVQRARTVGGTAYTESFL
ncbi:MAG TPA: Calx-beta domain-containing protein, partial [Gemmataceae bacterium]|nr:Calx-beta domain-containing protein [Gemmataceae bacterium]